MRIDIQASGITLPSPLRHAVELEAHEYSAQFPKAVMSIRTRLFNTNGARGGLDKGCLLHARMRHGSTPVVATDIDADVYHASPPRLRSSRAAHALPWAHARSPDMNPAGPAVSG